MINDLVQLNVFFCNIVIDKNCALLLCFALSGPVVQPEGLYFLLLIVFSADVAGATCRFPPL